MTVKSSCWHWGNRISLQGELGVGTVQCVFRMLELARSGGLLSDHGLVYRSTKGKLHLGWFGLGFWTFFEFSYIIKCFLCAIYYFKCSGNINVFNPCNAPE